MIETAPARDHLRVHSTQHRIYGTRYKLLPFSRFRARLFGERGDGYKLLLFFLRSQTRGQVIFEPLAVPESGHVTLAREFGLLSEGIGESDYT
jgi:hypothetical protein